MKIASAIGWGPGRGGLRSDDRLHGYAPVCQRFLRDGQRECINSQTTATPPNHDRGGSPTLLRDRDDITAE